MKSQSDCNLFMIIEVCSCNSDSNHILLKLIVVASEFRMGRRCHMHGPWWQLTSYKISLSKELIRCSPSRTANPVA